MEDATVEVAHGEKVVFTLESQENILAQHSTGRQIAMRGMVRLLLPLQDTVAKEERAKDVLVLGGALELIRTRKFWYPFPIMHSIWRESVITHGPAGVVSVKIPDAIIKTCQLAAFFMLVPFSLRLNLTPIFPRLPLRRFPINQEHDELGSI